MLAFTEEEYVALARQKYQDLKALKSKSTASAVRFLRVRKIIRRNLARVRSTGLREKSEPSAG